MKSYSDTSDTQAVIDIFSEYRIFNKPTTENISLLCKRAAHVALIQHPCYQLQVLGKEMYFFKSLGPLAFDAIYTMYIPNPSTVIGSI